MLNSEFFHSYVHLEDFTPLGCPLKKRLLAYSQLLIFKLVLFDVKISILQDLTFRLEVREVILYLLLIEV